MTFEAYASRTHEKMKDVLMHPEAEGPATHYYMIRGGSEKRNITIWEAGTVGGEYIKAYGHYHVDELDETYWILAGEGIILQQKLVDPKDPTVVEFFKAISVKAGDTVYMPPNVGHLAVNTGNTWFVTADDSPVATDDSASMPVHADYEAVKKMRGFAYYVVEKDGKPVLVPNKLYKQVRETDFGGLSVIE